MEENNQEYKEKYKYYKEHYIRLKEAMFIELVNKKRNLKKDSLRVIYHGTTIQNGLSILESGCFDSTKKKDEGWGITYGEGIYFTPNLEEARVYGKKGILLEVTIFLKPFYLDKDYAPTNRNHKKELKRLIENLKGGDRNCLLNKRQDEIIFFGESIKDKRNLRIRQIS